MHWNYDLDFTQLKRSRQDEMWESQKQPMSISKSQYLEKVKSQKQPEGGTGARRGEGASSGCGAEMPSCEREPSVKLGRIKGRRVIVTSHRALRLIQYLGPAVFLGLYILAPAIHCNENDCVTLLCPSQRGGEIRCIPHGGLSN